MIEKCLYIGHNKACKHRLGDKCILLALNTNQRQRTTMYCLLNDQLTFSASPFTLCTPWKGLLASPKDTWRKQDGRRAAQDTMPTAELPVGMLPVPTASETIACSSFALKTWASCDPWSQSCPTEVPFNLAENNRLFSCWPNIKCHFHANFQAWTQAFVFQRMLQKASAFCTDGCSQDLENNPPELRKVDFAPYELMMTVILLNIKGYS